MEDNEAPVTMTTGADLRAVDGTCGFKITITNPNKWVKYSFTLLRDDSIALAGSIATALVALTLF